MRQLHLFMYAAGLAALSVVVIQPGTAAQERGAVGTSGSLPLRIVGHAVSVAGVGNPTGTARVEIAVTRISPEAARTRLFDRLTKTGQRAMLDELMDEPSVGSVRFGTELAWDLRYAQRERGEDGGIRLSLMTDRPMGVFEIWNNPRYSMYPFTMIDLQLDANGRGKGEMILAARITADPSGRFVHVENFASDPIRLEELEAEVDR
jgi:hypothetical protein